MKPLTFLYTDGKDVVVTEQMLKTKNARYYLKGVNDFRLAVIEPRLFPGLTLLLMGIVFIADTYFDLTPYSGLITLTPTVEFFAGVGAVFLGLILLIIMGEKYALRIETAEGYKNVVISKSREYIDQVLNALRKAKMTALDVR